MILWKINSRLRRQRQLNRSSSGSSSQMRATRRMGARNDAMWLWLEFAIIYYTDYTNWRLPIQLKYFYSASSFFSASFMLYFTFVKHESICALHDDFSDYFSIVMNIIATHVERQWNLLRHQIAYGKMDFSQIVNISTYIENGISTNAYVRNYLLNFKINYGTSECRRFERKLSQCGMMVIFISSALYLIFAHHPRLFNFHWWLKFEIQRQKKKRNKTHSDESGRIIASNTVICE